MMREFFGQAITVIALSVAGLIPIGAATPAMAHGGVKLEQDQCVMRIGPSTMHFIGYQRSGEEQEFCEDIANTGPTVIGLSPVSPELRDMAIGLRVIRDVGGEANEKGDLDAITVAKVEPKVYRNGIFTFEHDFKDAGRYVGIVTVRDDLGNEWVSRFPFSVGLYTFWGMIEYILYGVGFLSLVGALWFVLRSRMNKSNETAGATA
jgi:hypothetical protein